jgi:hypothetical protein
MDLRRQVKLAGRTTAPEGTRQRKRTAWARIAVLVVSLCAFGIYAGVAHADGGPAPTLASDAATYARGDTVQLTGGNWLAGQPVHVHVADSGGHGWRRFDDPAEVQRVRGQR